MLIKFIRHGKVREGRIISMTGCCFQVDIGGKIVTVSRRDLVEINESDSECE